MPAILKTSKGSAVSAGSSSTVPSVPSLSTSRLAEHLRSSARFWKLWLRQPALDVAEASLRLRRLRGMSQAQLARKLGTQQPAIARLESGTGNPRLSTVVELAEALGATVRVEMTPLELAAANRPRMVPWWTSFEGVDPQSGQLGGTPVHVFVQATVVLNQNFYALAPAANVDTAAAVITEEPV